MSNADIAWRVGYEGTQNLYAALARTTGCTPGDIRRLSEAELQQILHGALEIGARLTAAAAVA